MQILPKSIRKLIEELSKLPGIGNKSASRLAFFLLKTRDLDRDQLGDAVKNLKTNLAFCQQCHNLSEGILCQICASPDRKQNLICIVEEPLDVVALEQGRRFEGTYHVLGGVISPIDGMGPDNLKIAELLERIKKLLPSPDEGPPAGEAGRVPKAGGVIEIIIATNPSLEGEGTAMYLARELKQFPQVKLTRIAHGLPIGGDIEYADELTIMKALEGRREYKVT
ncbi:MAG: recombination protein RecR [Candidatus Doudnabacteria bacterium]|nr:recombination protein RecR [Candidatus Doudnabacteria bacterium]